MMTPYQFQKIVLTWFDQHGRKTLPWQQNKTPYRVFVSEIMLQQTQVSTVIPYFQRFITQFPTVQTLATANEDDVLHLWTGLGYYNRARHLHRTANIIVQSYNGQFPNDLLELQKLPGIGRSTAGAIAAIAFEKQAAILDGNVKRVLTRLHGMTEWPGEKKTLEQLWMLAEQYTPKKRIADYTQAMIDIGATLCIRGKPHCNRCPLQLFCVAHQLGIAKNLPKSKPSNPLPTRQTTLLIIRKNHHLILLEKRPPHGIWGGLWSMPEILNHPSQEDIRTHCQQRFRCQVKQIDFGKDFRHTFSHFHLQIRPVIITIKETRGKALEKDQQIWYNLQQPEAVGLPAPVKKLLQEMT